MAFVGFEDDRERCHHMPPMPPVPDHEPLDGAAGPVVDAEVIEADEVAEAAGADGLAGAKTVVPVLADVRRLAPP
ncbi:MAG: hypothetical protein WAL63_11655, partial [Solirubrobacteraceae bacterium]